MRNPEMLAISLAIVFMASTIVASSPKLSAAGHAVMMGFPREAVRMEGSLDSMF